MTLLLSPLLYSLAHSQQFPAGVDPDADGPLVFSFEPLPNFAAVSPSVFRSGQPTEAGLEDAKRRGVRTILDLRLRDHEDEERAADRLGLSHEKVRMNGVYSPTFEQVDRALEILTDPARAPVLVHCHFGKDRTGLVIAAYRIVAQGWSLEKAAAEARSFGCCAPFFISIEDWLQYYLNSRDAR